LCADEDLGPRTKAGGPGGVLLAEPLLGQVELHREHRGLRLCVAAPGRPTPRRRARGRIPRASLVRAGESLRRSTRLLGIREVDPEMHPDTPKFYILGGNRVVMQHT